MASLQLEVQSLREQSLGDAVLNARSRSDMRQELRCLRGVFPDIQHEVRKKQNAFDPTQGISGSSLASHF